MLNGCQFLGVRTFELDDRLQLGNLVFRQAFLTQFCIHVLQADLVEFVDGYGNIYQQFRSTDHFGDAGQNLAVVHLDSHTDTETVEYLINNLNEFHFVQQAVAAHHIRIALEELTVASFLGTIGTPDRLYLVALEGEAEFFFVHRHKTGKRNGQVITQTFFANAGSQSGRAALLQFLRLDIGQEVTGIENLEKQFVALLSVFAHQGREVFHRRGFNLLVAVQGIHVLNGVEYIVSLGHLNRAEVAGSFRNAGFHLCHVFIMSLV